MQRLTEEVKSLIRTGVALPSVTQVIEELLLNSIDAGASNVAVRVDLSCFKIQVVDNGHGITADQFDLIGERYATSKCHSAKDLETLKHYGFRGEALASIKNTSSFLEIVSRAKGSSVTFSKCFQQGKQSLLSRSASCRPSFGTTITVHNLFYNLPVRQIKSNVAIEMEKLRYRVCGLALMWPNVGISIRNDSVGQIILQTKKCNGTLGVFFDLFTTARPADVIEMSAEKEDLSLWGFISKDCHSQKDIQFVYINKRLVLNSCIHKLVNRILGHSIITKRREQSVAYVLPSSGSPSKHVDSYGMFLLNISCPFDFYDITFDPKKTLVEFSNQKKLTDLIQDMIYGLLRKEKLLCDDFRSSKGNLEQGGLSNFMTQSAEPLRVDDEESKKSCETGKYNIIHPNILSSKAVRKCDKNLLHSFDDSSGAHNKEGLGLSENKEDKNSPLTDTSPGKEQQTIGQSEICGEIEFTSNEEYLYPTSSSESLCTDTRSVGSSSSNHQNIPDEICPEKCESTMTSRPLKRHNDRPGLHLENRCGGKANKPALSKISVDKSVNYVSTLSCLREFVSTKRVKDTTNTLENVDTLTELRKSSKPTVNVNDVPSINTLTEIRNATKQSTNINNVVIIHTLTKLKNAANAKANDKLTELESTPVSSANVNNLPRIKTLTELKKATNPSGDVNEVSRINTLTELKNATRLSTNISSVPRIHRLTETRNASKPSEILKNVTRIDTLTELKKATKSATNVNVVLRTPCTTNGTTSGNDFTTNDFEQSRCHGEQECVVIPNEDTESQMSHMGKTKSNEFILQTPGLNRKPNIPDTPSRTGNCDTPLRNNSGRSEEKGNTLNLEQMISSDSDESTENIFLPSSRKSIMTQYEHNVTQNMLPESVLINQQKTNVSVQSADVVKFCNYAASNSISNTDESENTRASSKRSKADHFIENITTKARNVKIPESSTSFSLQPVSSCESNYAPRDNLQFSQELKQSPDSCSENGSQEQTVFKCAPAHGYKNSSLNNSKRNEDGCSITTASSNHTSSATCSQVSFQHKHIMSYKIPTGIFSPHEKNLERNESRCTKINEMEKTDDKVDTTRKGNSELFENNSEIVINGTFNLKSMTGCKDTQPMGSSSLFCGKQLSLLENKRRLSFDVSLKLHPKSSITICGRKRKLLGDIELSAHFSSPKKFHCSLFQNDFDVLNKNFFSTSNVLRQFFGHFINRPLSLTGLCEKSMVPALTWEAESRPQSKTLHAFDWSAPGMITPIDPLIKTLYNSISHSHSRCDSIESGQCSHNESSLEMSDVNEQVKELITENLPDKEPSAQLVCYQGGQAETSVHSFNSRDEFQSDLQKRTCTIDTPMGDISDCHSGTNLENRKASPNNQVDLLASEEQHVLTDTSIRFEMDHWKNPVFKKHKLPCLASQMFPNEGSVSKTCYSFINGLEFSRGMLQNAKVIGQVEMKFIACIIEKDDPSTSFSSDSKQTFLVLFDQHAVHERIRLESLTRDAEETNKDTLDKSLKRTQINPAVTLSINKDDARIVRAFQTEFQRIGVDFHLDASTHNMQSIIIHSLPLCMTQRDWDGKQREEEEIARNAKDLIQDQIQHLKATNGVHGRIPLSVHRVLCSQACRGAIKFGDPVSLTLCQQLMKQLSECCLPFQCAHGRPSIVPLVNLTSLEMHSSRRMTVKPQLAKISTRFSRNEDM